MITVLQSLTNMAGWCCTAQQDILKLVDAARTGKTLTEQELQHIEFNAMALDNLEEVALCDPTLKMLKQLNEKKKTWETWQSPADCSCLESSEAT